MAREGIAIREVPRGGSEPLLAPAAAPALPVPAMRPRPPGKGSAAGRPVTGPNSRAGRVFRFAWGCPKCGSHWWWCTWERSGYGFCLSCWSCGADRFFYRDGRAYEPDFLPSGLAGRPRGGRPGNGRREEALPEPMPEPVPAWLTVAG